MSRSGLIAQPPQVHESNMQCWVGSKNCMKESLLSTAGLGFPGGMGGISVGSCDSWGDEKFAVGCVEGDE